MDILGKARCGLFHDPWQHLIIKDLINPEVFSSIQKEITCNPKSFAISNRENSRVECRLLDNLDLWAVLYGFRFVHLLETSFGCRLKLRTAGLIQLRRATPATPAFPKHADLIDQVSLVTIFYISPDWNKTCGGELELYRSLEDETAATLIEPVPNTLVAFRTERDHIHAIRQTREWTRLTALAEWHIL